MNNIKMIHKDCTDQEIRILGNKKPFCFKCKQNPSGQIILTQKQNSKSEFINHNQSFFPKTEKPKNKDPKESKKAEKAEKVKKVNFDQESPRSFKKKPIKNNVREKSCDSAFERIYKDREELAK